MRLEKDKCSDTWFLYFGENSFIHFINEWNQFNPHYKWNWITFTPLKWEIERDIMCPGLEIEVIVLGFGLRFRQNYNWEGTEIQRRLDEIKEKEVDK